MARIKPPGAGVSARLSVIIPVRNDAVRLRRCLEALSRSSFRDFELIVVDDASDDDSAAVARSVGANVIQLPCRAGSAAARNAGAQHAGGGVLLFVDSDVLVHRDTLQVAMNSLDDPAIDAVFGSYDLHPHEPNLLSQYKNLAHRYYHQSVRGRATTFWTGCGAIRRDVFARSGGFDAQRFKRPAIEDIELGVRLTQAGQVILNNKRLQVTHLKRWSLWTIIKSDIFDRAIPWTRLTTQTRRVPNDLNLARSQRAAAALVGVFAAIYLAACWHRPWLALGLGVFPALAMLDRWTSRRRLPKFLRIASAVVTLAAPALFAWYGGWWALAMAIPLIGVIAINAPFYAFFARHRSWMFAAAVLPMHLLYYFYGGAVFVLGTLFFKTTGTGGEVSLADAAVRRRLYIALAMLLHVIAWGLVLLRAHHGKNTIDFVVGDGVGFYIYLPSLVIDRDLEFQNQLNVQFRGNIPHEFSLKAMKEQKFLVSGGVQRPIGVALSVFPGFIVAHELSRLVYAIGGGSAFQPNGYSLLYQALCAAMAMAIGTASMILADRLLTERFRFSGRCTVAAVLSWWLGTNYVWFFVREPFMAHMLGASWIIFAVYLVHRVEQEARDGALRWWRLPLLALCFSMAVTCRLSNMMIFPVFLYLVVILVRHRLIGRALTQLPLILVGLTPLILQWIVLRVTVAQAAGATMGYSSKERFIWDDPALFLTLFSSQRGLFFWTPMLLVSAWALLRRVTRERGWRDPLLACLLISAAVLWYVNASWYAWHLGNNVGHRGFIELAALFIIGFGFAYTRLEQMSALSRRIMLGLVVLGVLVNYTIIGLKLSGRLDGFGPLLPWEKRVFTGRLERF